MSVSLIKDEYGRNVTLKRLDKQKGACVWRGVFRLL